MPSRRMSWIGVATVVALLAVSSAAQSASVSNFSGVFDRLTNRIQFSLDINPVDATTPNGVGSLTFDFDNLGSSFQEPFIPGSTLLFSSVANATGEILDDDEFTVDFPVLTVPTSLQFIVADIGTAQLFLDPSYTMDIFVNLAAGATPSTLKQQLLPVVADQSDFVSAAVVPLPAAAWLFLGALGSLGVMRWLRRQKATIA